MRRSTLLVAALAAIAFPSAVGATSSARSTSGTKVQLRHTKLGTILVNARGFTLYIFALDSRNRDRCVSIAGCTAVWPVLKTRGRPIPGSGVKRALLGTIRVRGGAQVTYAGRPLYTYIGDSGPGETSYVGFRQSGGAWYAINARGKVVK
jgi:predicted lipoprotein with Yx(FWY)xxD motif